MNARFLHKANNFDSIEYKYIKKVDAHITWLFTCSRI